MLGVEPDDPTLGLQHLLGVDEDIRRLALETAERLMDVQARIGQRATPSPGSPAISRNEPIERIVAICGFEFGWARVRAPVVSRNSGI